jgi:hydrogenase maturation protease
VGARAPVLVLAVGNPSRGDDALGPLLAGRIEAAGLPDVEIITEFQLQVENSLDLEGRELVLFVDAGTGTPAPFELREARPDAEFSHTTHALSPESVLATYVRVKGETPPPAVVLCIRGESFELGDALSPAAASNLEAAWALLRDSLPLRPSALRASLVAVPGLRP